MNEIINRMMILIETETATRDEYMSNSSWLHVSEGETEAWRDANLMYHRSCASVRAMKEMFKLVTGIPYETAVERMGEGA